MIVHLMGDRALLLECSPDDVLGYSAAIRGAFDRGELRGIVDIIPAASTVLVKVDADAREHLAALSRLTPVDGGVLDAGRADIDVVYDGEDLADVAEETGLSRDDVIALHTATTYRVAFCGFAPGFAYLTGVDERLAVPRLPSPRSRVPAGSVAIAAGYTAVYPRESPGGWRLIGRSSAGPCAPSGPQLRHPAARSSTQHPSSLSYRQPSLPARQLLSSSLTPSVVWASAAAPGSLAALSETRMNKLQRGRTFLAN